ncbi:MAG: HAMP domain-containing sensor histidine kinase [Aestuariivirga sp.]
MFLSRRIFRTSSFRLAALCAALFAVILAVLLVLNLLATNHALEDQLRSRVREDFNSFSNEAENEGTDTVIKEIDERIVRPTTPGSYFYVADSSGKRLVGNLNDVPRVLGWQKLPGTMAGKPDHEPAHEIWGQGKIFSDGFFVFVGQDAFRVNMAEKTLIMSYVWSGVLAILAALAAGLLLSRGFLSRIDAINHTSQAIMQGNLKQRIASRGTSDEIDNLSDNLNRLFDSNQALLDSLRQVTVNIAHDLRTPLSRLRNRLDDLKHETSLPVKLRGRLDEAIAESDQLLATFSALLRIAQIESGSRKKVFAKVSLSELAEKVFAIYQAVAEDEDHKLIAEIKPNIVCLGDEELLLQLCVNLVENAIRHTPKGTNITLRVASPATLQVADNGPGIPMDQRDKVQERFYRLEQSRTTSGNGLGLALVAAIASLHDTKLVLEDNQPGLRASIDLQPT